MVASRAPAVASDPEQIVPTEETTPAKGEPVEIPIPTREEIFRKLGELAKPRKAPPSSE